MKRIYEIPYQPDDGPLWTVRMGGVPVGALPLPLRGLARGGQPGCCRRGGRHYRGGRSRWHLAAVRQRCQAAGVRPGRADAGAFRGALMGYRGAAGAT